MPNRIKLPPIDKTRKNLIEKQSFDISADSENPAL